MEKKSKISEIVTSVYGSATYDIIKYVSNTIFSGFSSWKTGSTESIQGWFDMSAIDNFYGIVAYPVLFLAFFIVINSGFKYVEKRFPRKNVKQKEILGVSHKNLEILGDGTVYNKFVIYVSNEDKSFPITQCYATLEYAADVFMVHDFEQQKSVLRIAELVSKEQGNIDRIRWSDNYANEKHEREIVAGNNATLVLADNLRGFGYSLGSGKVETSWADTIKVHVFKLRIDGLIRGESTSRIFEGYIYITKDVLLFEEGDYRKDERIKEYLRKQ